MVVKNRLEAGNAQARIPTSMVYLVLPEGDLVKADVFEAPDPEVRLVLEPNEEKAATVVFNVNPINLVDVDSFSLQIGELDRHPVSLNSDGEPLPFPYPADGAFVADGVESSDIDVSEGEISLEPRSVVFSVEDGSFRASSTEQLVFVELLVSGKGVDSKTYEGSNFWRLRSSGVDDVVPLRVSSSRSEGGDLVSIVFLTQKDISDLTVIANPDGVEGEFPVEIPDSM